jgi:hypothetical protein
VAVQIVLAAIEKFMLPNVENHVQIPGRSTFAARITFAGNSKLGTVVDTGGNFQLERLLANNPPLAVARFAFVLDDLPGSLAMAARTCDGKEALLKANLPVSIARGTRGWSRTLFRAAAIAFGAGLVPRYFDLRGRSKCGFFETEVEIVSEIGSALNPAAAATRTESITKTKKVAEDIAEIGEDSWIETTKSAAGRTADTLRRLP